MQHAPEIDAGSTLLATEAAELRRQVRRLSATSAMVTLRVDRVVAFDTAGLGLLLGLHRLARANGAGLVLLGPGPRLEAALRRRGLHRVLVIDRADPTRPSAEAVRPTPRPAREVAD